MKKLIILVAVLFAAPLTAHAQAINFGALDNGDQLALVTTGAEHGLVLGAGYARAMTLFDHPLVLSGDAALQWAEVDPSDFRLRAGALVPIVGADRWKLIGGVTSIVRGTNNDVARMINVGADVMLAAGYYAPHWFAAGEGGFDWAAATHVTHSDAYRMRVYADARDGWYGNAGATLRYGLHTGVSFGGNDVVLRAGRLHDIAGQPAAFPLYVTLGYDRRF